MYRAPDSRAPSPEIVPRVPTLEDVSKATGAEPDVRQSFADLPAQWFWTWLTGKPASGQEPRWRHKPWTYLAMIAASLLGSVMLGLFALDAAPIGLLLLPVSWILTVHGARALQVSPVHYCVHGTFSRSERINRIVGEIISTFLMITPYPDYKRQHGEEHHGRDLATITDPDVRFLRILGFEPGATFASLRRHLRTRPIAPSFHWAFLKARIIPNLGRTAGRNRRLAAWTFVIAMVIAITFTGAWIPFLVLWIFPLTALYHVSSLWQFTSEHLWLRVNVPGEPRRITLHRLTSGRFCGEPAPGPEVTGGARVLAWLRWFARMLLIHLPSRLFVLAGDLAVHDWHHRHAKGNWRHGPYERQRDLEAGRQNYTEVWGLKAAVDRVLRFWSELPPQVAAPKMTEQEEFEQFSSM